MKIIRRKNVYDISVGIIQVCEFVFSERRLKILKMSSPHWKENGIWLQSDAFVTGKLFFFFTLMEAKRTRIINFVPVKRRNCKISCILFFSVSEKWCLIELDFIFLILIIHNWPASGGFKFYEKESRVAYFVAHLHRMGDSFHFHSKHLQLLFKNKKILKFS